jgi:sugar lactone lactonase YvrE
MTSFRKTALTTLSLTTLAFTLSACSMDLSMFKKHLGEGDYSSTNEGTYPLGVPKFKAFSVAVSDVAIASSGGMVVLNTFDTTCPIQFLSIAGDVARCFKPTTGAVADIGGIAVDSNDNIFVTISGGGITKLEKYDSDDNQLFSIDTGGGGPQDIVLDSDGTLLVILMGQNQIARYSQSTGALVTTFGTAGYIGTPGGGTGAGDLGLVFGMTIDKDGNIYATNGKPSVQAFNRAGTYLAGKSFDLLPTAGFGAFSLIPLLIADKTNGLYVVTNSGATQRVSKFDLNNPGTTPLWENDFSGELDEPTSVTMNSSGLIYFNDQHKLFTFNTTTNTPTKVESTGLFKNPIGIKRNADGSMWVGSTGNLKKVTGTGTVLKTITFTDASDTATSVATDSAGNVYTTTMGGGGVFLRKFTAAGAEVAGFASGVTFVMPLHVAVQNNKLYVVDMGTPGKVFVLNTSGVEGTPLTHASLTGPTSVDVNSSGEVVVLNSAGDKVIRFDASGNGSVVAAAAGIGMAFGVALADDGTVYATDHGGSKVWKVAADDSAVTDFVTVTSTALVQPTGVALDSEGNVYITDMGLSLLLKFNPAGVFQLQ